MFRRVSLIHHKLLPAVRSRSAAQIPKYCTVTQRDDDPTKKPKNYDLSTYKLPYSTEEEHLILDTINRASPDDLTRLKLTKGTIRKVTVNRGKVGSYQDLSQLLLVAGLGIKGTESLCRVVLRECIAGRPPEELPSAAIDLEGMQQRRLIKPRLSHHLLKSLESFVSLHVTAGYLAWARFDQDGRILDLSTHELLHSNSRFDTPRIYEKVSEVSRSIPKAPLYVWEERANHGHLVKASMGTVIISLQLAQIKGMLTALLETRREEGEMSRLVYMRDMIVPRLFKLQVGGDRISGLTLADRLMEGEVVMEWLPGLDMEEDVHDLYFSMDQNLRRYSASALYVGIAFHQAMIEQNQEALSILWR